MLNTSHPLKPEIPLDVLSEIAAAIFGIAGRIQHLSSERDQNATIGNGTADAYVLKVANANEDPEILRLQNAALTAAHGTDLPVPRVIRSRQGNDLEFVDFAGQQYAVRLLTRVRGEPLARRIRSGVLRREVGAAAAHLDVALATLDKAGERRLIWDMSAALGTRRLLPLVTEPDHQRLLAGVLDDAESEALPKFRLLPMQWIHNDLNMNNLLALPERPDELSGIIDFGDMLYAPRVVEVAIAAAHQCVGEAEPLAAAVDIIEAYHRIIPLNEVEIALLPRLIALRLTMAVLIQRSHAAARGDSHFDVGAHSAYIRVISLLSVMGWDAAAERIGGCLRSAGAK